MGALVGLFIGLTIVLAAIWLVVYVAAKVTWLVLKVFLWLVIIGMAIGLIGALL